MKWLAMIFVSLAFREAWAVSDRDTALKNLHVNQGAIDAALSKLRRSSGLEQSGTQEKPSSNSEVAPLFRVHASLSSVRLPIGKVIYGAILNRLVIGADGSPVIVRVDDGQGFVSGLRMLGVARQAGTSGRVSVEVKQLILTSGQAVTVQAVALDSVGAFGLEAEVFSSKAIAVAGSMGASFISGLAAGSQSQATSALGFSQVQPTGRNALLQGVAQTAADQSKRLLEESTAEKPVLVVGEKTPVSILIQEEVRL